ncbi:Exosome complex component rrp45 [Acrodontium crateriforme]|uniref:Exosome complex component RRP45 n=1 Tax=Acrodontium crateriforme TaxID=150365 RepID=A0AAQ3MA56_9PEZI|nr:Exosome complex component rrp45 [Acrodontium crateriforme]
MPREADPSTNEQAFLLSALRENIRLDGRALDAYRPISLSFGEDYGTADVRIGKTRVRATISADVVTPFVDRKFDGVFTISTELSPMASPAFEVGRQDQTEILLSRILEKTVRRSGALDTESLCIVAGQKCFHIRADIHVMDHDGNLVDASCLALIAALLHFRRPDVEIKGEEVTVFSVREREPVKLAMQHQPFCVTTSCYEEGTILLHDATLLEEQCREGDVLISMNKFGEICQIAKYGGAPMDGLSILTCTNTVLERVKIFDQLVKDRIAEDEKRRDVGGLIAELSAENDR